MKIEKLLFVSIITALCFTSVPAVAEKKIIKDEEMSFETCLKVISDSETKLAIASKISKQSDQKHSAKFILVDGSLTITCDGKNSRVIVFTNSN